MDRLRPNGIKEIIRKNSYTIEIGGKSPEALMAELSQNPFFVSDWARGTMQSPDFSTLGRRTEIEVARLTPADVGFIQYPTTEQFLTRQLPSGWRSFLQRLVRTLAFKTETSTQEIGIILPWIPFLTGTATRASSRWSASGRSVARWRLGGSWRSLGSRRCVCFRSSQVI